MLSPLYIRMVVKQVPASQHDIGSVGLLTQHPIGQENRQIYLAKPAHGATYRLLCMFKHL